MLEEFRRLGALHTLVLPTLYLFVIPTVSLLVFEAGEAKYDRMCQSEIEKWIRSDSQINPALSAADRDAIIELYRAHPVSKMLKSSDPEMRLFAEQIPTFLQNYYMSFRWLIRLAWLCILSGVGVIALTLLSVPLTAKSPRWQYRSLLVGWHLIRLFMTLQVIAQASLIVGLSFWTTALVADTYFVQLIVVAAILAAVAVSATLNGIFVRLPSAFPVTGDVLREGDAPDLWGELKRVAEMVGADTPDQMIVGIDDNFFVTEQPLTVGGRVIQGKTLFVSLAMLKTLSGKEAEAIVAHEFAHFSGDDTYYSRQVAPLLGRFNAYLQSLHDGVVTQPMFSCTLMLRQLYELAIQKLSREREFRADAIAAKTVTPQAVGDALVRTMAYSAYRRGVEEELFDAQTAHERVDIGNRVAIGFQRFAPDFADSLSLRGARTNHPFDSHPTLEQRLEAVGCSADVENLRRSLAVERDGAWFAKIPEADRRESALRAEYEDRFSVAHNYSLAYRYLPGSPSEEEIVARDFPEVVLPAKNQTTVIIDHEKVIYQAWPVAVRFDQLAGLALEREWGVPQVIFATQDGACFKLPLDTDGAPLQHLIQTLQRYWERCSVAVAYNRQRYDQAESPPTPLADSEKRKEGGD